MMAKENEVELATFIGWGKNGIIGRLRMPYGVMEMRLRIAINDYIWTDGKDKIF